MSVKLLLYNCMTLKDKRGVVKSIIDKLRGKFNLSAAQTGGLDMVNHVEIGIAMVSSDTCHLDEMMQKVINFLEDDYRFEITDIERCII